MSAAAVRVGVVGLGRVSGSHIAAYQTAPNATVVSVCDSDPVAAASVAARLGVEAYDNLGDLLANPSIDAVALLLPHPLHYVTAKSALDAGKHVCLEKPGGVSSAQLLELGDLAEAKGLALAITHNTRYAAANLAAQRLIEIGELGDVRLVRISMIGNEVDGYLSPNPKDRWRRERNGIGALLDCASHYFYLLHWMLGDVKRIQAIGRNALPGMGVEDYALVSGEFGFGGWFTVEVSLTAEITWQERMEIHGTRASLIIDHKQNPPAMLYAGWKDRAGTPLDEVPYDPVDWRDASIAAAVSDFLAMATGGRLASVSVEDAAYALRLVEKANESVADGGQPVTI